MIKKESYGFNSFAGLRVGEIQQKTDRNSWNHVPSKENIADILTKGAPPNTLGPSSTWQAGRVPPIPGIGIGIGMGPIPIPVSVSVWNNQYRYRYESSA